MLCHNSICKFVILGFFDTITDNGLGLGEEADFETLNCLSELNLIRNIKFHLSTEPDFLTNSCCAFVLLLLSTISLLILSAIIFEATGDQ